MNSSGLPWTNAGISSLVVKSTKLFIKNSYAIILGLIASGFPFLYVPVEFTPICSPLLDSRIAS